MVKWYQAVLLGFGAFLVGLLCWTAYVDHRDLRALVALVEQANRQAAHNAPAAQSAPVAPSEKK